MAGDGAAFTFLRDDWGIELDQSAQDEITYNLEQLRRSEIQQYIKDTDLRKLGVTSGVPRDLLARKADTELPPGKHFVQLQKTVDITQPKKFQEDFEGGKWRLLVLELYVDGHKLKAIEYGSVKSLGTHLPPGTKILLWSSAEAPLLYRGGHFLLTQDNVQVLGGHVEHMYASWQAQNDVESSRLLWRTEGIKKKTADGEGGAPRWVAFDPKKCRRGREAAADKQAIDAERRDWLKNGPSTATQAGFGANTKKSDEKEARFQVSDFASAEGEGPAEKVQSTVSSSAFKQVEKGGKGKSRGEKGSRGRQRDDDWGEEMRAPAVATATLAAFIKPAKNKTGELSDAAVSLLTDPTPAAPAASGAGGWAGGDWDWDEGWAGGGADWSQSGAGWNGTSWGGGGGGKSRKGGKGGGKGKGGSRKGGGGAAYGSRR